MRDPFTEKMYVECSYFSKLRRCEVMGTAEAKANPHHIYNREEIHFIDRPEDMYASHHYTGKNMVRLTREDWKRGLYL